MTWAHLREQLSRLIGLAMLPLTIVGLVLGLLATWAGNDDLAWWAWTVPAVIVGVRLAWQIVRDLLDHEAGVDVIALLAIAGALAVGESFAAAIIAVMLATGEALEDYAQGRAKRELTALLARAPQEVTRYVGTDLEVVPVAAVTAGDRILVRPGEVVPVDGVVIGAPAVLDESALTGESRMVTRPEGDAVASGVVNGGGPFDLRATATAEASTYAGIVRLVRQASRSKAPFVRLADRYGLLFVPLTLAIAGIAWLVSGDPVRALAVLVVATPCPLILAVPIAIVSGISRAAKRGIIVKGGGPLETLARARVILFDKTGTLTAGRPRLASIEGPGDPDELLRMAAALEQASPHVLAAALVAEARARGLVLPVPTDVLETPGSGVAGRVEGREVRVGLASLASDGQPLPHWARDLQRRAAVDGTTNAYVALDGRMAGAFVMDDPVRPDTPRAVRGLRRAGFTRIVMVTGDHAAVAEMVAFAVGLDGVLADRKPDEKVAAVREEAERANGPVVMVGDGINDAPALAAADVGVAMGARGATSASEAADIVVTVDRLDRLTEAVQISRRARTIALQSVFVGMGLSLAAMVVAAFGFLPVIAGALLQEAIDVTVILNALRALRGGVAAPIAVPGWTATNASLVEAHLRLAGGIARLRTTADRLGSLTPAETLHELRALDAFLVDDLLPHEQEEDDAVHPALARAMGNDEATAAFHGTHNEIYRLARIFRELVDTLPPEGPEPEDLAELRRVLYGLHAILRLHQSQEEELYASVTDPGASDERSTVSRPAQGEPAG
jgi:heavy metal translocating P-type ATPase